MRPESPFVLVHGAWQTAATWDLVAPRLRASGGRVFNALLTGLESDGPALNEAVTLDTHIRDVVELLERGALHDVVLVGHSYAGMIITGVAEHARHRIARLVYIDAFVPDDGQSALQLLPESIGDAFRAQADADGGWRLRSSDRQLDLWGLEEGPARVFVRARLSDFSIRCFQQPLAAPTRAATAIPRTYIACVRDGYPAKAVFDQFARRAQREGWDYHALPSGHDCHVELPDIVSDLLLKAAASRDRALASPSSEKMNGYSSS